LARQSGIRETAHVEHERSPPKLLEANLVGTDSSESKFPVGANLTEADVIGADLSRAKCTEGNLTGATVSRAGSSGATCAGATLRRIVEQLVPRVGAQCKKERRCTHGQTAP
jgi:uncharacterized protein YjbI with pentapeptide repeats